MNFKPALDPARIAKLEEHAARNPGSYRRSVALLSVFGDVVLTTALVVPIALPIFIGLLFFQNTLFFWLGGIALLFLIWMVRPGYRFSEREVKPEEAPALFEAIQDLQKKLNMPGRVSVAIDESFNAAAVEGKSVLGFGAKRTLVLGVPLLCALSRDQVLAIVAHEFGHFSRRHGRLGHWLYRARVGWLSYAEVADESDSALEKSGVLFAEWFVPMFSSYSFVLARRCEYEADADAAYALGAPAVADALVQVHVKGQLWDQGSVRKVQGWQREMEAPPEGMHALWSRDSRAVSGEEEQRLLQGALKEASGLLDTHPSLTDRLAALKEPAELRSADGPSAGEAFFAGKWASITAEFDQKWRSTALPGWRFEHFRFKHLVQPLLGSNANSALATLGADERLARARLLAEERPDEAKTELTALRQSQPGHAGVCFTLAEMSLESDPETAFDLLKEAKRIDPSYRVAVSRLLIAHAVVKSNHADVEKHRHGLQQALKQYRAAGDRFANAIEAGKFNAPSLGDASIAVLRESMSGVDAIVQGWVLAKDFEQPPLNAADDSPPVRYTGYCVVLRLDPEKGGEISHEIGDQSLAELSALVEPNALVLSRVIFTTEAMPEDLQKAFDTNPACCCFKRA